MGALETRIWIDKVTNVYSIILYIYLLVGKSQKEAKTTWCEVFKRAVSFHLVRFSCAALSLSLSLWCCKNRVHCRSYIAKGLINWYEHGPLDDDIVQCSDWWLDRGRHALKSHCFAFVMFSPISSLLSISTYWWWWGAAVPSLCLIYPKYYGILYILEDGHYPIYSRQQEINKV